MSAGGRWGETHLPPAVAERLDDLLDTALDKALVIERPAVLAYLDRIRSRNPKLSPAQLIRRLERRYLTLEVAIGGAAGAAAALPGTGTGTTFASGAAEITGFVSSTALFVLALAELHSLPVSDPEVRRALVVAVLVGASAETVLDASERGSSHWARVLASHGSRDKPRGLDERLGRLLLTRFGARQGVLLVGRALPLGIGAGIGAVGNAALARSAIATARTAFGPPPARFPPRVIDVRPVE